MNFKNKIEKVTSESYYKEHFGKESWNVHAYRALIKSEVQEEEKTGLTEYQKRLKKFKQ